MSGADTQLWCAVAAGCILAAVIFHRWLAALLKLLLRTLLGGGALAVLSLCSGITGLTLGVNPSTRWCWAYWARRGWRCCVR